MEQSGRVSKTKFRVVDLVVDVSARLAGNIEDWPANIQDGVYKALADKCHDAHADFKIVQSYSDIEYDTGVPYIHVIAVATQTIQ